MSEQRASLDFWFEFASPYSYIAASRLPGLCAASGVALRWRPFLLGPIFQLQGWATSPFNVIPRRGAYMWRDMERLCEKFGLPWKRPRTFPRDTVLAARIAAAHAGEPWIEEYVHAVYLANFARDLDLDEAVLRAILRGLGEDADRCFSTAVNTDARTALRRNTDRAIALGIFGAPNCVVGEELFWGEETLEDAISWALRCVRAADWLDGLGDHELGIAATLTVGPATVGMRPPE